MFQALGDIITRLMDYVLGWVLYLPPDLRLFVVAVMTSGIMAVVRLWSTPQEWLRRADADKKRLAQLIKQARRDKDQAAKARYKETLTLIKLHSVKYEGKPLLWAIIPVVLIAVWCFYRIGFHPPKPGQAVQVKLYVPASGIGRHAHVMPQDGLEPVSGWVQRIEEDRLAPIENWWDAFNRKVSGWAPWVPEPVLGGVATWRLRFSGDRSRYRLRIRYGSRTEHADLPPRVYEKDILVGTRHYTDPLTFFDDDPAVDAVEAVMRPVRLFGFIGGLDFLFFLPPWLVAYLLILIPALPLIKRILRIY